MKNNYSNILIMLNKLIKIYSIELRSTILYYFSIVFARIKKIPNIYLKYLFAPTQFSHFPLLYFFHCTTLRDWTLSIRAKFFAFPSGLMEERVLDGCKENWWHCWKIKIHKRFHSFEYFVNVNLLAMPSVVWWIKKQTTFHLFHLTCNEWECGAKKKPNEKVSEAEWISWQRKQQYIDTCHL